MPTEAEIRANYKETHDLLSDVYYAGLSGLTKEQFDLQHGQNWDAMRQELIAEGYLTIPEPPRDLAAEIDELKMRFSTLEGK